MAAVRKALGPSQLEELKILDARVAQVLGEVKEHNIVRTSKDARRSLKDLRKALTSNDWQEASSAATDIEAFISEAAAVASGWDEIRATLETRDKLARTEIQLQRMLAEKVMLDQIDMFIKALVMSARELTEDRAKLTAYVMRVNEAAGNLLGNPLLALSASLDASETPENENDVVDVEVEED
jgi:hypothetical protein